MGIVIDNSGKIWNKNKELQGHIQRVNTGNQTIVLNYEYRVYDINKIQIATLQCTNSDSFNGKRGLKITTYDNKEADVFVTKNDFSGPVSQDKVANRMVRKLFANGYTLGDMKDTVVNHVNNKNKMAESEAKSNSRNIYNSPGYIVDKNGTKKEGNITIEFESIDAKLGKEKGMGDLTNYGGTVTLNVDGKDEFFKAKDGVKFCTGERCFIGVAGVKLFGENTFAEIISENKENYVLLDVKNPDDYYLKLANQTKAVYLGERGGFGKRKPEKIKKIFDEYVKCPALDFSKYNTATKEGLVNVLTDYQKSCN